MVFDKQMVILNKRFTLKLDLRHDISPFVRLIPFYKKSERMPNPNGLAEVAVLISLLTF